MVNKESGIFQGWCALTASSVSILSQGSDVCSVSFYSEGAQRFSFSAQPIFL